MIEHNYIEKQVLYGDNTDYDEQRKTWVRRMSPPPFLLPKKSDKVKKHQVNRLL
jgi:hypothetical protein